MRDDEKEGNNRGKGPVVGDNSCFHFLLVLGPTVQEFVKDLQFSECVFMGKIKPALSIYYRPVYKQRIMWMYTHREDMRRDAVMAEKETVGEKESYT